MVCNRPECGLEATRAFVWEDSSEPWRRGVQLKCDEHAAEIENIVRVAQFRPAGLLCRPSLRNISLEDAIAFQVMEA
jgi:hypothetical protein